MSARLLGGFDPALLARIEDAGINASAPTQQRWLDGWLLRLSPGKAKRARCINALARGRLPLADKMRTAEAAFAEARLPLVVRITPFTEPPELDALLEQAGLQVLDDTRVMVAALDPAALAAELPATCTAAAVEPPEFAEVVGRLRGSPEGQRRAHAERLLNSPLPVSAWQLQQGGATIACGQYVVEGDLVGLYDVFTAPTARNRGLARALCAHLLREAAAAGARTGYLQVDAGNLPARAVYTRLGFRDGYSYHYRTADPAAA